MESVAIEWANPDQLDPLEQVDVAVAKKRDLGYALEDAIADLTQALQAVGRFTDDSVSSSEDGAMDASFTSGESGSSQN